MTARQWPNLFRESCELVLKCANGFYADIATATPDRAETVAQRRHFQKGPFAPATGLLLLDVRYFMLRVSLKQEFSHG